MHINAVLSYLGAWQKLHTDYRAELNEIRAVITGIDDEAVSHQTAESFEEILKLLSDPEAKLKHPRRAYSPKLLNKHFSQGFRNSGWRVHYGLFPRKGGRRRLSELDCIKNGVVVEHLFHQTAFAESNLFVKFPLALRAEAARVFVMLVPMQTSAKHMPAGIVAFEVISERIKELLPLPLKYPFAIMGLSDRRTRLNIAELTSDLDLFLLDMIGCSLDEMKIQGEAVNYDFKEKLPESKKVAQEVCAFANLAGGGLILLGIDNSGHLKGIPRGELDKIQLSITNVVRGSCMPLPELDFRTFDIPNDSSQCILVVKVSEVRRKPCMAFERVYVRSAASARPAGPDEVRQLVLESAE